ncbi:MAG: HAMP domain-containing histidine kinase [Oscillospiraceae bacterium]|nr:HAMP domain-containing histidine kinase [Oscillospiraceae bacterium]
MNRVEKKFVLYAMLAIFVLLTVLLAVINVTGFTMASEDADRVTQMIAGAGGAFGPGQDATKPPEPGDGRMGPMGPDSPELGASVRYFTAAFDSEGQGELIAFNISAVTRQEALQWAQKLSKESTGWTRGTYRYRVYELDGRTYVTVIDQGRELLSSYRILIISICGEAAGLILSFFVLMFVTKRLFAPLKEADRKQKMFIAQAEREFKLPLTVIRANTEVIELENGPSDNTRSINRQVERMSRLVKRLGTLAIFHREDMSKVRVVLSDMLEQALETGQKSFDGCGIALEKHIQPDVTVTGEPEALRRVIDELIDNAVKYSLTKADFTLAREGERISLTAKNDTQLPNGSVDEIFDRFTRLSNADGGESTGLDLAYVKDIVRAHNGRVGARVADGEFILKIDF